MFEVQPPDDGNQALRLFISAVGGFVVTMLMFWAFPTVTAFLAIVGSALTGGNVHIGSPLLFILIIPLSTAAFGAMLFAMLRKW